MSSINLGFDPSSRSGTVENIGDRAGVFEQSRWITTLGRDPSLPPTPCSPKPHDPFQRVVVSTSRSHAKRAAGQKTHRCRWTVRFRLSKLFRPNHHRRRWRNKLHRWPTKGRQGSSKLWNMHYHPDDLISIDFVVNHWYISVGIFRPAIDF